VKKQWPKTSKAVSRSGFRGFTLIELLVVIIIIGILAGFYGDDRLTISRGKFFMIVIGILFAWFYGFQLRSNMLRSGLQDESGGFFFQLLMSIFIFSAVILLFFQIGKIIERISWLNKKFLLPADTHHRG
jgi:prepilin-type N-terminal cleavage/methylation domain-containing protein